MVDCKIIGNKILGHLLFFFFFYYGYQFITQNPLESVLQKHGQNLIGLLRFTILNMPFSFFPSSSYRGKVMYYTPPTNPTQPMKLFDHVFSVVYPPTGARVTCTTSPVKPSTQHLRPSQRTSVTTHSQFIFLWVNIIS